MFCSGACNLCCCKGKQLLPSFVDLHAVKCDLTGVDLLALWPTGPVPYTSVWSSLGAIWRTWAWSICCKATFFFFPSNNFGTVFSAWYSELQLIQTNMKNACLSLPRGSWARWEKGFPNKVKVKEYFGKCMLLGQPNWVWAVEICLSFLNEGCVLSVNGAKNISDNFWFECSSFLSGITWVFFGSSLDQLFSVLILFPVAIWTCLQQQWLRWERMRYCSCPCCVIVG